jgi:hypothetical protein
LVRLENDTLTYLPFAMEGQSNEVNVIPDFSFAGYKKGGVAIPEAPVKIILTPVSGDNTKLIQDAIDMVGSLPIDTNGFRGAVLLRSGCYEVDQLFITRSGVVLRGEGQGLRGTVLYAKLESKHDVITLQGAGSGIQRDNASRQKITTSYVPLGTRSFEIEDPSDYQVGDTISVLRTPNQFWIEDLGMDEETLCQGKPGCNGWTPNSYTINHERVITQIDNNTITVDLPLVDVMEEQYGGGEIYKASVPGRIQQCGVESLRIESYFDPNDPNDEDHAWIGVHLKRTINSWVTNVTGQYLGYGTVSISSESNFNTIQECAAIDHVSSLSGGRRYSFNISDGMGNLFQRNYTRGGRHDYVTGSRVTGPNVFLDCYSSMPSTDIGPHHRWTTGTLFDNIRGSSIRVRNRGNSGSGHGWAGNATMFWNLVSVDDEIHVESPKGGRNWGIGCKGVRQLGGGYWELWNSNILPRSLYLQQLEDRLGTEAVDNITIPAQLTGDIYELLESWAGELDFGIPAPDQFLFVAEDASVRGGDNSSTNYGNSDQLEVKENSGSANNDRVSFLKFDLSQLSAPVYNARLRMRVSNSPPTPDALCNLHFVQDDTWNENTVTWENQPSFDSLLGTLSVPNAGNWLEFEITPMVNAVLNGDKVLSLRLSEATMDNLFAVSSKEYNGLNEDPHIVYDLTNNPPVSICESGPLSVFNEDEKSEDEAKDVPLINILPNPTNGLVNIRLHPDLVAQEVRIFSLSGIEVMRMKKTQEGEEMLIDLSKLMPGVYIIRVGSENQRIVKN